MAQRKQAYSPRSGDASENGTPKSGRREANPGLGGSGGNRPGRDDQQPIAGDISAPLDPRFTFENFVVGKPNELAYAAARPILGRSVGA